MKRADTWRALARELDVKPPTIRGWRKHPTWPATFTLPVDVAAVRVWRETLDQQPEAAPTATDTEAQRAATRLRNARAQLLETRVEQARGTLVPYSDVEAMFLRFCSRLRAQLLNVPRECGAECEGLPAASIERAMQDRLEAALREFAGSAKRVRAVGRKGRRR